MRIDLTAANSNNQWQLVIHTHTHRFLKEKQRGHTWQTQRHSMHATLHGLSFWLWQTHTNTHLMLILVCVSWLQRSSTCLFSEGICVCCLSPWRSDGGSGMEPEYWCQSSAPAGCWFPWWWAENACRHHHKYIGNHPCKVELAPVRIHQRADG